jgi:phenylacetate-CoA ligase
MIYRAASIIRKNIIRFPNFLNRALLRMNRSPGLVLGREYIRYRSFVERSEDFDPKVHLLEVVNAAVRDVAFYRGHYGGKIFSSVEQFKESFGFIDKDIVMADCDAFVSDRICLADYDRGTTGGTGGKPLRLIAPKKRYIPELATMHSLWANAGYRFHVRAVIRNHRLPEKATYRIDPLLREVIFDGFRLTPDYFRRIYQTIRRFNIAFIHCYPSTACEFAAFLFREKLDVSFIKAFLSGSENILEHQAKLIEDRLGVRFYNFYGHSEKLVLAGYCAHTNLYHVEPTYGFFELVDGDGKAVTEPGKTGEIVGTSFHNPGMPLIRYRTGDFAEYVGSECGACGRKLPIIRNIRGRWRGDKIYNRDGSFVTTTALNLHDDLYSVIDGLQYIQEKKGELEVLVIRSAGYRDIHEEKLNRHFRNTLNPDTRVRLRYVDRLVRQPNGKFLLLVSSVDNAADAAG